MEELVAVDVVAPEPFVEDRVVDVEPCLELVVAGMKSSPAPEGMVEEAGTHAG